ncbi:TPA: VirB4 family type IV secretion/conjugal transfer ATPase [Vibrio parahaemolyticus]|uniref:VirB4 family type IV secretion/conjugal transfer ATPase n=1 Tax=Vibrio parahaemolyticus TaxID=670 RepID=UPI00041E8F48|nr:VirB4 family type IV secretion/conjugal transfer ATPase [Vibrio parahaemolyticus]EKC5524118.1 VirB4 family type IV secretion/conjugal transfer ATPase [Vibrio parahaemolyticus]
MFGKPKFFNVINNESPLANFIPYSSHVSSNTLITKDGALVRIFKLDGLSFETKDIDDLALAHQRLNSLYKSLAESNVSIWTHCVRCKIKHSIDGEFDDAFSQRFNERYHAMFGESVMVNQLYLTVVQRPAESKLKKGRFDIQAAKARLTARLDEFDQIADRIQTNLSSYHIISLGISNGISEPLTFLNYLLTAQWQRVKASSTEIHSSIGHAWVKVDNDTIELEAAGETRYLQGLDIKEYCQDSYCGVIDSLLYTPYEFVLTQSFSFFTRKQGLKYLKTRERQLANSGDDAITQIVAMTQAKNDLADGQFAMGEYHFSIMVIGDSLDAVKQHRSNAQKLLSDKDIMAVPTKIANDATFFAQLPANWQYRPRIAGMTTLNFASFAPFHNFLIGKRDGNPWGAAVTRLKTLSGHPFFFNFHYTVDGENNFGDQVAGNTRMIGMTGSGKTVALGLLYCQAQKYAQNNPFSTVFFDKDRGAEVMIRALGGHYLRVEDGKPSGFNPFQMDATPRNLSFLKTLVRVLAKRPERPLTVFEEQSIDQAVNTVMRMDKSMRRLSLINQNIAVGTSKEEIANSIKLRIKKWCQGGEFGWVFDNPVDELDFTVARNIGIDGTEFLDNDDVRTPISMYLLHRMEDIIDGRRFIYVMDEAWKWVNDEAFSDFVGNKQLTIRKQNGLGVFATQLPSSLLESPQGAALVQSCSTEIYLPNPKAKYDEYVNGFGLTEKEFSVVQNLGEKSRLCLIKQGTNSAVCSLAMPDLGDELTILSAGSKELPLFDEAVAEVGNNPSDWIPVFLDKVKAMRKRSAATKKHPH